MKIPMFLSLGVVAIASGIASAQTDAGTAGAQFAPRSMPLVPKDVYGERSMRMAYDADLAADLGTLRNATFSDVPLPRADAGFDLVDLELERVDIVPPHAQLWVDGELVGGYAEMTAGFSAWTGSVKGEEDSEVYLAFSSTGSRGYVDRAGDRTAFIALRNGDGTWNGADTVIIRMRDPEYTGSQPAREFACDYQLPDAGRYTAPVPPQEAGRSQTGGPIYRSGAGGGTNQSAMAVETDHAFWQLFGNTTAANDYLLSLWGAISAIYANQVNTSISVPYVALYSTPADPWSSPEAGGGTVDLLFELDDYWSGSGFPNGAHLGHIVSGDNLGGGVAYYSGSQGVGLHCDDTFGVGVSADLGGVTSFPPPLQDAFNWDIMVCSHETGHNWGTQHTHDFCPTPLDECAPSGFFGSCQTAEVCTVGTIMSYCHLCPGGVANVQMQFHPTVAADLTTAADAAVLAGCIDPPAPTGSHVLRNGTGVNLDGFREVTAAKIGQNWDSTVDLGLSGDFFSFVYLSTNGPASILLNPVSEILIAFPFSGPADFANGVHSIPIPNDPALVGTTIYTQAISAIPASAFFNAIDICIGS